MAKTRMLKTDLRTSEKVASWPIEIRYFWVLLWGYVDDHGKAKDNPLLVKADCFPLDPAITGDVIDRWLWGLVRAEVIVRYTVAGVDYLQIVNWSEHQRPQHPTQDVIPAATHKTSTIRQLHAELMNPARNMLEAFIPELSRDGFEVGEAPGASEPPPFCDIHPSGTAEPCRRCGDARVAHQAWLRAEAAKPPRLHKTDSDLSRYCEHSYLRSECEYCEQAVA